MTLNAQQAAALVKTGLFTLLVPWFVGFYLPALVHNAYLKPSDTLPGLSVPQIISAFLFLIAGITLYLWCAWNFAVRGLGTPAPLDAPKRLVVEGPYRHVRNPMYEAVLFVIAYQTTISWSLLVLLYLIFVLTCFYLFVLIYEEPHLRKVFGSEYQEYCRQVHRWLPRLRPAAA